MVDSFSPNFTVLGDLGKTYQQAKMRTARERSLAALGQGASIEDVAKSLFQVGDVEGGLSLARLADAQAMRQHAMRTDERDFAFRQQEAQRTQQNADRSFGFQTSQANKPVVKSVKDASGNETLVRVPVEGDAVPISGGVSTQPDNPYSTGKMNESQSKDALYASRMTQAEQVLRGVEQAGTSWWERVKGRVSDKTGYNIRGPDYQKFDQARRDFVNATLRRESGAVISDAEFDNADTQYFPVPGDTAEVLAQKRKNRAEAIRGIGAGAGPNYRPENIVDREGNIAPNPSVQPKPKQRTFGKDEVLGARQNRDATLQQAKDAIAAGADRNAVINRLRQIGIDPSGL